MIKKKSMLALLLVAAMLCTCLPVGVLAADGPQITYGLFDGAVVDAAGFSFGVSGITEAPSVTIGGVNISAGNVTYADGTVTVTAESPDIAFGKNNITVKSGDDTIFSGNIVLEKFAAPVSYGQLSNFTVTKVENVTSPVNTCTLNNDTGYYEYTFHREQKYKDIWCYASTLTSATANANSAFGVFDFSFKAKINENIKLDFQIFRNTSEGKCNENADGDHLAYEGYLGDLKTNVAMKLSNTNDEYTFDVRIDQPNGKWTIWATKDGGEKMFVKTMDLTADIKKYGFNHARIQVSNRSDLINGNGTYSDTTCSVYKTVEFDQKPLDTFKIDSVTADGVALTADDNGAYTLTPDTDTVEVTFNKAITGTVTLGSTTASVNNGNTAKFTGLSLNAGSLDLTVPSTATATGLVTLGNKFVAPFTVSDEFAIASPVDGGSYEKGEKIFSIYESDKTVSYKLNGTSVEKSALADSVNLGKNTLEILVDSTEYKRISFNVTDTVIYGTLTGVTITNSGTSTTGKDGDVPYTRYPVDSPGTDIQVRTGGNNNLTLRDESTGTNRDNRSLSGRFVYEIDLRFVRPDSAAKYSADATIKFMYRDKSTTNAQNGINNGRLTIAESGVVNGSNEQLEYDKWYNFKVVADMVNNAYEIYVDGKLAHRFTSDKSYLTADSESLIMYTYRSAASASLDLKDAKTYFEVPVGIENVTYGEGTALTNGVAPITATSFGVTTQLRIPDSEIETDNIQLIVDGENVATAAAKNTNDGNYLGAGVEKNNETKTTYYNENEQTVYKPLWYSGTKGTKIDLTVSVPAGAKKGEIVIKKGTKVIATDWKYTTSDDNGANVQKLIALENDVIYPVYFTDNGVYAELSTFGNDIAATIITDGTQTATTLMAAVAQNKNGSFDVSTEDYTITAGDAAVATKIISANTTSAASAKAMLWFKNSLKPIVDFVTLK